jgi:hypothetical protein
VCEGVQITWGLLAFDPAEILANTEHHGGEGARGKTPSDGFRCWVLLSHRGFTAGASDINHPHRALSSVQSHRITVWKDGSHILLSLGVVCYETTITGTVTKEEVRKLCPQTFLLFPCSQMLPGPGGPRVGNCPSLAGNK